MNPRETARKLIAQAVDPTVTNEEARSFAAKAAKLIHEHDLLAEPPRAAGFGGLGAILSGLPIERIMDNVNTAAIGAAAIELIEAKARIATLERENERLRIVGGVGRRKSRRSR